METTTQKLLDPDSKTKTFPFPNGSLKKHHILRNPNPNPPTYSLYRECLKNHAASLGGHALDGCGEFMPVPGSNPSDPTSLKCAACGCHRNFHRRLPDPLPDELDRQDDEDLGTDRHMSDDDDSDDDVDDDHEGGMTDRTDRTSSPPPTYFPSAPQMLLALSTGAPGVQLHGMSGTGQPVPLPGPVRSMGPAISPGAVPVSGFSPGSVMGQPRKRFRTKFSPEQKQRMHELSEKLGWRLQKRDEGLVEEWCREIGVGKGVFKVWMHNNKHVFLGTGKRGESRERMERDGDGDGPGVALGMAGSGLRVGIGTGEGEAGTDGTGGISHVMNGSGGASSSS